MELGSLDGYIGFDLTGDEIIYDSSLAMLVNCEVRLAGRNRFGRIKGGTLHIQGWVAELSPEEIGKLGLLIVKSTNNKNFEVHEPGEDPRTAFWGFSIFSGHRKLAAEAFRMLEAPVYAILIVGTFLSEQYATVARQVPKQIIKKGMLVLKERYGSESAVFPEVYKRTNVIFHRSDILIEFQ